ncbi:MAG TPA: biopolymer transporter ExbD [Pirellulaceae bacterium]|nr:biopolymer transporter ExbD [Pirellulaceae bacterium]
MRRVLFRCPNCGASRGTIASIVGRRIRCADCLEFVTITDADVRPLEAPPGEALMKPDDSSNPSEPDELPRLDGADADDSPLPMLSAEDVVVAGEGGKRGAGGRWKEVADDSDLIPGAAEEPEEAAEAVDFGGKVDRETIEMDMTPMVDVTFLLLIFFMVTASFTMMKTIRQPPPSSEEPSTVVTEQEDNPDQVVVFIDEFDTYTVIYGPVEAEAPSVQELYVRLREAIGSTPVPPTKLLVEAHGDATHEKVVLAMDAGTEVGLQEVQVMMTEREAF